MPIHSKCIVSAEPSFRSPEFIISKLYIAFSNENIKNQVLTSEWLALNKTLKIDSVGFCYAASEVLYRLTGGREIWKKMAIYQGVWSLGGHCYLIEKENDSIWDITSDQYTKRGITIPYGLGRAGGFRAISNKAKILCRLSGLGELI